MFSQEKSFDLLLNAGKFVPQENIVNFEKDPGLLQRNLFLDKYYVILQFRNLPATETREQMRLAGIELIDYIPNLAYTASINKNITASMLRTFDVRSIVQFNPGQKTVPDILNKKVPTYAEKELGFADVSILLYEYIKADKILPALATVNATILTDLPIFRMYTVRVPIGDLTRLLDLPFIQWMEYIDPPNVPENLPGRSLHRANILNDGFRNLKGDGMNIGMWDEVASQHLDFSPSGRLINMEPGTAGSHGTHTSGTVGSRGLINPLARGMAPNATIYSYNGFNNDVQVEMSTAVPNFTLISSNHSYHDGLGVQCGLTGNSVAYSLRARNTDVNLNDDLYHLHCHSAGNNQTSCAGGYGTITGTGKAAKNNLVVAAVNSLEGMTTFSSWGPVHDGRIKPEISALGENVFSTYTPLNTYGTISGTSMSTPGVTGTVAVIAQRYKQLNGNVLPPSALIKNTVCNTATDLGNPGPDYKFGFGRINALAAVRVLEQNRYDLNTVSTGGSKDVVINVPPGAVRLRVMLTWNDPAAAANVSLALVNNLDLRVFEGANTYFPWLLNGALPATNAIQADDNISNIEQVTVNNPAPGTYVLRVIGELVPVGASQTFALTWDVEEPRIELTYPNGGESFNPSTSQVITWDNAGITGNQTVEFSLDNGGTWTVLSNTVPAATTRFSWSVPVANTSTALVRVSSGSLIDQSDVNFKILGTPTGFAGSGVSCNPGEIIFNWTAVTNATAYDIYKLDPVIGDFVPLASNISLTTYTATGLIPNASMWFTIRAKNGITNSLSERANAVNVTVSAGGAGLSIPGIITGQTSICGTVSNINYSINPVPGASVYNWSVPPGAIIVSGQGTTSVSISFPAGSVSGNVNVTAGNGVCETAPSSLAVNVGVDPVAPTSGGNQSQTICPGNPLPTLTATSTVPAGHSIVWYSSSSGGTVVASPVLNTAGSVTYYAVSRNTSTGCESTVRTAVVLTIISIPAASATASGTTTFCQGANVVLTATAGTSYVWRKDGNIIAGATAQTYTASSSGSYTVLVTTSNCSSTSNAINVVVNALPVANITASGVTTFCQGGNVVLTASAGSSWVWSNGATTQSITVANSGNYSVTVTNASSCSSGSASTGVSVSPSPVVSISASPFTRLYPGLNTTLTANVTPPGTYSYQWYRNGLPVTGATSASLPGIDLGKLGSYTVMVTNTAGLACSNTSPALSIGDSATTKLFIYPSPNTGEFAVVYYTPVNNTVNTVVVYDSKGSMVLKKNYTLNSAYQLMNIDMRRNGKGIYRVLLFDKTGKKMAQGSVVIQ